MRMTILALIASILLIGMGSAAADVIPPNSHSVSRCLEITNLADYPSYVLVGVSVTPGGDETRTLFVEGSCMDKGYKFSRFTVYAVYKDYFDAQGLDAVNLSAEGLVFPANATPDITPLVVPDSDPRTNETLQYRIAGINDSGLVLVQETPGWQQTHTDFFSALWCALVHLFGGTC